MFRVEEMCRVFEVSRSGYYRWLKWGPSPRELSNRKLDAMIRTIYDDTKGRYGSPKITPCLHTQPFPVTPRVQCALQPTCSRRPLQTSSVKVTREFRAVSERAYPYPLHP